MCNYVKLISRFYVCKKIVECHFMLPQQLLQKMCQLLLQLPPAWAPSVSAAELVTTLKVHGKRVFDPQKGYLCVYKIGKNRQKKKMPPHCCARYLSHLPLPPRRYQQDAVAAQQLISSFVEKNGLQNPASKNKHITWSEKTKENYSCKNNC